MKVSRARTVTNEQKIAKPVGVTQHFITKKYMALDSPIIVRVPRDPGNTSRDSTHCYYSNGRKETSPENKEVLRTPISVDYCPVEEFG